VRIILHEYGSAIYVGNLHFSRASPRRDKYEHGSVLRTEVTQMEEKKVELVFGQAQSTDDRYVTRGPSTTMQTFSASVDEIKEWFKDFEIHSMELWVSGGISTGGVVKLFVSANASGGMKIILKPKKSSHSADSDSDHDKTDPK
jgi:hypothetical protein